MSRYPQADHPPRRSAGLLLRVRNSGGRVDEIYVAPNLSIGRSVANNIVLDDDAAVDLHHAKVELAGDGSPLLRCLDPTARLNADGASVWELPLDHGVRFSIGQTNFECVSAGARSIPAPDGTACPFCGSGLIAPAGDEPRPCDSCGEPLLPIRPDPTTRETIILPASYGEYQAERYVARGGMGLVLQGSRRSDGRKVAIKVIPPSPHFDRRDSDRFRREAESMSRVRHPNVVALLDFGETANFGYLILEWVDGPSLRERIDRAGLEGELIDFNEAIRWFDQVCEGLAAIHAVGLIHRDIKPSNILTTPEGVARIADFGIARSTDPSRTASTTAHAPGTYAYMAPEQLSGSGPIDHRADLYSMGATFYEVLTGSLALGDLRPASEINPAVPKSFDDILARLRASQSADRYGSIYELIAAARGPQGSSEDPKIPLLASEAPRIAEPVREERQSEGRAGAPGGGAEAGTLRTKTGALLESELYDDYVQTTKETNLINDFLFSIFIFLFFLSMPSVVIAAGSPANGELYALLTTLLFFISLILIYFVMRVYNERRAPQIEELESHLHRLEASNLIVTPRHPFFSFFLPLSLLSPLALWIAVQAYRHRNPKLETGWRSIIAMVWAGIWCGVYLLAVFTIAFEGIPAAWRNR